MADKKGYKTSKWHDKPNYECEGDGCNFSTLDEEEMKEHVRYHTDVPKAADVGGEGGDNR